MTPAGGLTHHDRRRLRVTVWTLAVAGVLGILAAVTIGLLGGSGRGGLAVLLVLWAAGMVVASIVTGILAVLDEVRSAPVHRRRGVVAIGLFLGATVVMLLLSGLGGA